MGQEDGRPRTLWGCASSASSDRCARGEHPDAGVARPGSGARALRQRLPPRLQRWSRRQTARALRKETRPQSGPRQLEWWVCSRVCMHTWRWVRSKSCNQANPMVGSRVQQTCTASVAQAAEVVRNGMGGTRLEAWLPRAEGAQGSWSGREAWPSWSLTTASRTGKEAEDEPRARTKRLEPAGKATTNGSMLTSVSTSFGRGQQCAGSGHTKRTSTEGRIFENTMRGVRQDSSRQAACSRPRTTPVG